MITAVHHNGANGRHKGFSVVDLEKTRRKIRDAGYEVGESGPVRGIARFFTRDPGGNRIDLLQAQ